MSVVEYIVLYLIAFTVFMAIDLLWLGVIAKERYRKEMKRFMVKKFKPARALTFYAIYIIGLLVMVLVPAINEESLGIAMFRGTAFGFFTYATYDLTNWAVIEKWPTPITFIDLAWGTFLGFSVSTISYSVYISIFTNV